MTHNTNPSHLINPSGLLEHALLLVPYPIVIFEGMELRVTYINDALLNIWAKDRTVLGQTFTEILPELEDQPFPALLRRVIETGETHTDIEAAAYFLRDGIPQTVYFDYSYTAIKNERLENIGVIVVCKDVTEQVIAKQKLKESEEKFRSMVLQAPFAIAVVQGSEFVIEMANERSLDIWGRTSDVLGKRVVDVFPELIEQGFIDILENVYATGDPFFGNEVPVQLMKDGELTNAYLNFVYHPILENEQVTSIMSVGYDVTDLVLSRKNAESQKALLEYLNSAGEELALSLDTKTALAKISKLIVPKFADWFTINILNGEQLDILMVINKDQEYVKWAREYRLKNPVTIHDKGGQGHILRTGESLMVSKVTNEMLEAAMDDKVHLEVIKKMNLRSSIIVPMKIGAKVIGTVNFLSTVDGKEYNETDLSFAKDFATRIALALENARLHEQQIHAIETNEQLLKEMEFERNRFEAVVRQMPGAVVIGEAPSGKLIFANEKINEVWGHPMKESENIGEYIEWIGFHPDGRRYQGHEWPLARSIQHGEIVTDEDVDIIRGDGKPAILRLSSAPIRDSSGEIIAGVVISQDVTELKQAIRGRDEFLSIASHELKTPLTTLTASIQILARLYDKEPLTKAIPQLIDTSHKSAAKLASLVRELLNVSKIESGQLILSKDRFNLAEVVSECCTHVRLEGTHELLIEGDLALEVYADQQRIDQVIVNFVNNAVKYAPGSPEIRLVVERENDQAKVSVIDRGIGIDREKLPHLFERYYRVDPSGMQYSGLGLGLYISSEIIKLHGGEIGVQSQKGIGSTFWFTIPIGIEV